MKKLKKYNLARKYHLNSLNLSPRNDRNDSSVFDRINHTSCGSENISNIFSNNEEFRIRKLQMSQDHQYQVVGMNQFQMYKRIKQKRKKDLKSNPHQFCTYISFASRSSKQTTINPDFLTKDEVLRLCVSPSQSILMNQSKSQELMLPLKTGSQDSLQKTWLSSVEGSNTDMSKRREKFSLTKLKHRMNVYRKTWEKHQQGRKQSENKENTCKTGIVLASSQKLKRISWRKRLNLEDKMNVSCLPWTQTLRSGDQSNVFKVHSKQRIESNGRITASGKSKLRQEKKWIEQKHNQGYFFSSRKLKIEHD